MSDILFILGIIVSLFGIFHTMKAFFFVKNSTIVKGLVVKRELKDNDECVIIEFNFENQLTDFCCFMSSNVKVGDYVFVRVLNKGNKMLFKLNQFKVLFTDSIILMPIGILLILGALLFNIKM